MGFFRQFLWAPFVLGTLLGGLTFADLYARWTETGWVGVPADIMAAYQALRDYFATLIVVDWLDLPAPPPWVVDFVVLSLVGWTTLIRATVRFGSEDQRNTIVDLFTILIGLFPNKISYTIPIQLLLYTLWMCILFIILIQPMFLVYISILYLLFGIIPTSIFSPGRIPEMLSRWRSELLFTGAAILNGAIAFGVLYWNSIAISRVAS